MRKALLLPAIFAVVVVPLAAFVMSGAGTHMSPMLLYLPAAPWWLIYPGDTFASEMTALLAGCAINAFLLYLVGAAIDQRARKRRAARHEPPRTPGVRL